jgi:hypothetical protein
VTSATDNSNKLNQVLEEKSVEDVLTLGPMAQATLVVIKYWACIVKIWVVSQYLGAFKKLG